MKYNIDQAIYSNNLLRDMIFKQFDEIEKLKANLKPWRDYEKKVNALYEKRMNDGKASLLIFEQEIAQLGRQIDPLKDYVSMWERQIQEHGAIISYLHDERDEFLLIVESGSLNRKEKEKVLIDKLRRYVDAKKKIMSIPQLIEEIEKSSIIDGLQAQKISNMPKAPKNSKIGNPTEINALKHIYYSDVEIRKKEMEKYSDLVKFVDEALGKLKKAEERKIIELRYFDFPSPKYKWPTIALKTGYSEDRCKHIHKEAITKLINF